MSSYAGMVPEAAVTHVSGSCHQTQTDNWNSSIQSVLFCLYSSVSRDLFLYLYNHVLMTCLLAPGPVIPVRQFLTTNNGSPTGHDWTSRSTNWKTKWGKEDISGRGRKEESKEDTQKGCYLKEADDILINVTPRVMTSPGTMKVQMCSVRRPWQMRTTFAIMFRF